MGAWLDTTRPRIPLRVRENVLVCQNGRRIDLNRARSIIPLACVLVLSLAYSAFGSGAREAVPSSALGPSIDLLAKFDPPITLTAWRYLNNGIRFEPGENIGDNVYIRSYKEDLGISLSYDWVVPEALFDQKLSVAVAADQLPDLMWLRKKELLELTRRGLLYDLTELFETRTSAFTKSVLLQDEIAFHTARINGRLMAIPRTGSAVDSLQILYVRADWLEKLGLAVPSTMAELLQTAKAFVTEDPDGNGLDDTLGLALTKNSLLATETHGAAGGFFAAYHAYPRRWIKTASGDLVYGSLQSEVKKALGVLRELYQAGLIDKEFAVIDRAKLAGAIANAKLGISYGGMSSPGVLLSGSVWLDPEAEWLALPLVSADEKPALPIASMPVMIYYAVSKNCSHPEALMKLVEMGSLGYSRDASAEAIARNEKFGVTPSGLSTFQYSYTHYEPALKNLNAHLNILDALASGDSSWLNAEELGYLDKITRYRQTGDRAFWSIDRIFGTPSSFDVIEAYVKTKNYLYDAFYGGQTSTMIKKGAELAAMENEVFTKIIMGQSLDSFDDFVDEWHKAGGSLITKEVNDWYKNNL